MAPTRCPPSCTVLAIRREGPYGKEEHMMSMTPEMRQRMQAMLEQCK